MQGPLLYVGVEVLPAIPQIVLTMLRIENTNRLVKCPDSEIGVSSTFTEVEGTSR